MHIVEAHMAAGDDQRLGAGPVGDLGMFAENVEHHFEVDRRLTDVAIDRAEKVQRLIKLDHHRVDRARNRRRCCARRECRQMLIAITTVRPSEKINAWPKLRKVSDV